jgi:toxin CcdB
MARFDVYQLGDQIVLDCQADLLNYLGTRFVVPLSGDDGSFPIKRRLNPKIWVDGAMWIMQTELGGAVRTSELGRLIGSADAQADAIISALDMLISGI